MKEMSMPICEYETKVRTASDEFVEADAPRT